MNRLIITLFLIACIASSCETQNKALVRSARYRHGGSGVSDADFSADAGRVVIFNARLNMTVAEPDTLNRQLARMAKQHGGYAVTLGSEHTTIRIPSAGLNSALLEIALLGKITKKDVSGNDVTDEYKDYESRLSNLTKARERYLELLSKAENVEATLKVEKELERVNGEMELLKGKLTQMKHLSDFSTIDIAIEKKVKPGVVGYVVVGIYKGVRWLFVRG